MKKRITLSITGLVACAAIFATLAFTNPDEPKKNEKKAKVEQQDNKSKVSDTDQKAADKATKEKKAKEQKSGTKKKSCCGHKH